MISYICLIFFFTIFLLVYLLVILAHRRYIHLHFGSKIVSILDLQRQTILKVQVQLDQIVKKTKKKTFLKCHCFAELHLLKFKQMLDKLEPFKKRNYLLILSLNSRKWWILLPILVTRGVTSLSTWGCTWFMIPPL